jgi:hyperosmotically inducible periplasmic protein
MGSRNRLVPPAAHLSCIPGLLKYIYRSSGRVFSVNLEKKNQGGFQFRFIEAVSRRILKKNMKRFTVPFLCVFALAVSAMAQDASPAAADNTAKNQRDRSGETQTSGDQSNDSAATQTTAAIRRAVVADDSLSMEAKNVKIITAGDTVTLRGPVNSADEKNKIEQLAQSAAGNAKIDNQLEVKGVRNSANYSKQRKRN